MKLHASPSLSSSRLPAFDIFTTYIYYLVWTPFCLDARPRVAVTNPRFPDNLRRHKSDRLAVEEEVLLVYHVYGGLPIFPLDLGRATPRGARTPGKRRVQPTPRPSHLSSSLPTPQLYILRRVCAVYIRAYIVGTRLLGCKYVEVEKSRAEQSRDNENMGKILDSPPY
jgi:hypothetical protein